MDAKKAYLVAYNAGCMAGWMYVGAMGLEATTRTGSLASFVPHVWTALAVVQLTAGLEVLHSVLGLVRSPVFTTFMQVFSRVWLILVVFAAPEVMNTWHAGMMAASWSMVEVPRYGFYIANLFGGDAKSTPYPLFWLRYSLFAVLYPTGITGEIMTQYAALQHASLKLFTLGPLPLGLLLPGLIKFMFVLYLPGSPIMYSHMVTQRKKQFKARFAKPPPPPKGVLFPEDGKGGRTTTVTGQKVFQAALQGAGDDANAAAVMKGNFRFGYQKHIMKLVAAGCKSPEKARKSAEAGLQFMYDNFEFSDPKTLEVRKFSAEIATNKKSFATGVVKGKAMEGRHTYRVPYDGGWHPSGNRDAPKKVLTLDEIKGQSKRWVENSIIEPDAGAALNWTVDYFLQNGKLDKVYHVMIGAGSAMGPLPKLLEYGANVVAIDIPGAWGKDTKRPSSGLWKRLIGLAKDSPGGSLIFPLDPATNQKDLEASKDPLALFEAAGCNLMEQPAEVANWLVEWQKTLPANAKVCIGNYTYLDGENHVKLALCADHCIQSLRKARPSTAVAFLCTPTDIHVIPEAAHEAAKKNFAAASPFSKLANVLSQGASMVSNVITPVTTDNKKKLNLVDGITVAQGPNYALAKRMQHWRAQVEFEKGATVSSSIAPSTATISVISNKSFGWAYGGLPTFGFEVFKQETTNAVMAALLIHDLLNEKGPKNPKNKATFGIENSLALFSTQGVHGGLWRSAYKITSVGEASALIYFSGERTVQLGVGAALVALAAVSFAL